MYNKLIIWLLIHFIDLGNSAKDYGDFDYNMVSARTCQGPKRNDCCVNTVTLYDNNVVNFIINCKENIAPLKSKVIASVENRQKLRLQMDKPCKHLFIMQILKKIFNMTENCVILKHIYRFSLNFSDIAQKYYSGMFIYGNWTFQSTSFNDACNFLCINIEVNISPKK